MSDVVTCHTDGCPNAGIPIEMQLTWDDEDGTEHRVGSVACGPCGQPITDIVYDGTPEHLPAQDEGNTS